MRVANAVRMQRHTRSSFACDCGLRFETREEARNHVKVCRDLSSHLQACCTCGTESDVLLPYKDLLLCPKCAVGFFQIKKIFGSIMINHMGREFEETFSRKVEVLLHQLGVETLPELGIDVVLITFSQSMEPYQHHVSLRGELVFMFAKKDQISEDERKVFESVINHEVLHGYITNKLKLAINDKLKGPFSFLEGMAVMMAEDIQLEKIAVRDKVWPVVVDEISRDAAYYEKLAPISTDTWSALNEGSKLAAMTSVTWSYAINSWFAQVLPNLEMRERAAEVLGLIYPHFAKYGYIQLKDLIGILLDEKVVGTKKESEDMIRRLVGPFEKLSDIHGLRLY